MITEEYNKYLSIHKRLNTQSAIIDQLSEIITSLIDKVDELKVTVEQIKEER